MNSVMADIPPDRELLRPSFRAVVEKLPDASVTIEDKVLVLRRTERATRVENIALVVIGHNILDPHLFERCAVFHISRFLNDGWSVKLLDFGFVPDGTADIGEAPSAAGEAVAKVIAGTDRLRYIVFFTHSRRSINLSNAGDDLVVEQPAGGGPPRFRIAQLRLSEGAPKDGWVDVFGCMCRPNVQWPAELAKALNWPVRTVYPGHGIYFPDGRDYPRSAIPLTRFFSQSPYRSHGWAVWFPGANRPLRVTEPGETAERRDSYGYLERLLVAIFSVALEPLRDFRKRRRIAALRQQASETSWSADASSIIGEKGT
jgi:hypothetical protein